MKYLAIALFIVLTFAAGCGSKSGSSSGCCQVPGINVVVVTPAGAAGVDGSQTLQITVKVDNDSSNAGVTWSVAPAVKGDPAGTLSAQQPLSVTYTPPSNLTAPMQVVVTATSVTDSTRSVALPISVYLPLAVATTSSDLATAVVNTDYNCYLMPKPGNGIFGVTQVSCQLNAAGGLGPYTWTVDGALFPPGLILQPGPQGATLILGQPTVGGVYTFKATVADALGVTASAPLTINVALNQLKITTPTLLSTSVNQPYLPVQLQASGGEPPYTWSLVPGSQPLPPGLSLAPSGAIYGTPTSTTTATFALQVQDSQTPVRAQAILPAPVATNAKILALGPSGNDPTCLSAGATLAPGVPYAFLFSGFDAGGPVTLSGSITSDSHGNLSGVEDIIRQSGTQLDQPLTGGTIGFDNNGRGCMTLNTATTSAQFRLVMTVQDPTTAAVQSASVQAWDNTGSTRGSGSIRRQDPAAFANALSGPYAFRLSGWDASSGHFALAGTATAGAGAFTSVTADVNDSGAAAGPLSGNGTFTGVDASGRGTTTIAVGTGVYHFVYYLVDAAHFLLNSTAYAAAGSPLLTGEAAVAAGPFSQASLSNSHIYRLGGSVVGTGDLNIGVLHFDGVGAISGTTYSRTGSTSNTTALSGQYAVDPATGRVTFSGTAIPAVAYLTSDANGLTAYLLGTGASAASGVVEFQTSTYPPGYQFSPVNGNYGLSVSEMLDPQTLLFTGTAGADLTGNLGGISYVDANLPAALIPVLSYEQFRYTWNTDGSGTFGANTFMVSNAKSLFYIDNSPLNAHPALMVGERWNQTTPAAKQPQRKTANEFVDKQN